MNSLDNYNYKLNQQTVDLPGTFSVLMRNVYTWMTGGLLLTAVTALLVLRGEGLLYAIASNTALIWGLLIAELVMVFVLAARIMKMSFGAALGMFAAYAVLNGVTLSFIFAVYTKESIAQTFFITAGTFAGMSLLGYVTKKDLSTLGRTLYMLLIGLIIATVVNIFFKNEGVMLLLNYLGVIIFCGLTAYDTQKIRNMMLTFSQDGVNDATSKIALLGSLTLYLDFINLFLYLLRFMGKGDR